MLRSKKAQSEHARRLFGVARDRGGYVVLHVPLPFKLPFEDGFLFGWDEDEPRFLELIHYPERAPEHLYRVKVGEPVFESRRGTEQERRLRPPPNLYTVARFGVAVPREEIDAGDDEDVVVQQPEETGASEEAPEGIEPWRYPQLERLLDEGLRALNHLIRAYRMTKDDFSVAPIGGTGSLPFSLLYTLWDVRRSRDLFLGAACQRRDDLDLLGMGLFLVNMRLPVDPEPLSFEDTSKVVAIASDALNGRPHPLFAPADLLRSAGAKLESGDYNAAVVESVTAVETFVSALLRLHLERRGSGKQQVDAALRADFRSKLKDHLARKMMGFDFDPKAARNPLEKWYKGAYEIRGDVVHRGALADAERAGRAFAQSQEVMSFLTGKIKSDPGRYEHIRGFFA